MPAGVSYTRKAKRVQEDSVPRVHRRGWRVSGRRKHLLLVVVLAVKLLVPVEAGGLQGFFAGGTLHALFMPEAVVEPQQKPVRDDPLTAFADRLGAHRSAYSSNRQFAHEPHTQVNPAKHYRDRIRTTDLPLPPPQAMHPPPGRSPDDFDLEKSNQVATK